MTEDEFRTWRDDFLHLTNGAQLFGSPAVADRVEHLLTASIAVELGLEFMASTADDETFALRLKRAWAGPPGDAVMRAQENRLPRCAPTLGLSMQRCSANP